jgi:hypothetical protein
MSDYKPNERDLTLGFMVQNPALIDGLAIPGDFFRTADQRVVWTAFQELREAGQPVSLVSIMGHTGDGIITYLNAITSVVIPIKPEEFRRRVYNQAAGDVKARIIGKIEREAKAAAFDYDGLVAMAQEARRLELEAESASGPISRVLKTGAQLQALEIHVDWTLDKLIPSRSLTLLHGPGGVGKTWLALSIANAVSEGKSFLGLATKQRPAIYIDFENPWPMLIDRVRRLNVRDVLFWHLSAEVRPPKLDGPDWALYKGLPAGSLLVFDTARASHDGDENSSQDVGLVMNRLKEIREAGFDILLLHHTTKLNERASKGSTAWDDLADHVLAFFRVKRQTLEEIDEEGIDPDALLSLGTGKKTRFEPARLFLTMDGATGAFRIAGDPGQEKIDALAEYIAGEGRGKNQGEIVAWAKDNLGLGRPVIALLKRGEREGRWCAHRGLHGRILYEPTA